MTTLADSLTKESIHRLHRAFQEGLELAAADVEGKNVGINQRSFDLVAEPIVRYVHYRLMQSAQLSPKPPNKQFPYKTTEHISSVLREEGWDRDSSQGSSARLVGDIGRILKFNGLMFNAGVKGLGSNLWLRPWDPGVELRYVDSHWKPGTDAREEARIAQESGKPMTSHIDLRAFKVPEPHPDKILDFIQRFVPAALKVQDQFTELRQALLEAQVRVSELEQQLSEEEEGKQWEGVTETLANLLDGKVEGEVEGRAKS